MCATPMSIQHITAFLVHHTLFLGLEQHIGMGLHCVDNSSCHRMYSVIKNTVEFMKQVIVHCSPVGVFIVGDVIISKNG